MGLRGPRPHPTSIRLVKGNPSKKALNDAEPRFADDVDLAVPDDLVGPAAAYWGRLAPMLRDAGVYSVGDRDALRVLCRTLARLDQAEADVAAHGMYSTTADGRECVHPAVRIVETATAQARALWQEFGLTPSARSRVRADHGRKTEDPAAKYFGGA